MKIIQIPEAEFERLKEEEKISNNLKIRADKTKEEIFELRNKLENLKTSMINLDDREDEINRANQRNERIEKRLKVRERNLEKRQLEQNEDYERIKLQMMESLDIIENEKESVFELQQDLAAEKTHLSELKTELEFEKSRFEKESKEQMQTKSTEYVQNTIERLKTNKEEFRKKYNMWTLIGACSVVVAIIMTTMFSITGYEELITNKKITWEIMIYILFKGLILITLCGALSRYCFVIGNANMHESIKNSERIHAIEFGEFYLNSFGPTAKWEEVKQAFANWNIESTSEFSRAKEENIDVKTIESLITSFTGNKKTEKEKNTKSEK